LNAIGMRGGQVLLLAAVLAQIVQLPRTGLPGGNQLPVARADVRDAGAPFAERMSPRKGDIPGSQCRMIA